MNKKVAEYMGRFPSVHKLVVVEDPGARRFLATFSMGGVDHRVRFGTSYDTYLDGASKAKRDSYRARASKIVDKKNRYTYRVAGTANSLAYWLLW